MEPYRGEAWIPIPPTSNHLYPTGNGRRVMSSEYRRWRTEAAMAMAGQLRKVRPDQYPLRVELRIYSGKGFRMNADIGNREKPTTDALVEAGVIADDNIQYVIAQMQRYVPRLTEGQPAEAMVTLVTDYGEVSN